LRYVAHIEAFDFLNYKDATASTSRLISCLGDRPFQLAAVATESFALQGVATTHQGSPHATTLKALFGLARRLQIAI